MNVSHEYKCPKCGLTQWLVFSPGCSVAWLCMCGEPMSPTGKTAMVAEMADQAGEIARLERWVADLQSSMYINCVYCGHRYGPNPGTPATMAEVLKAHVEQCPKHPMSALKQRCDQVEDLLAAWILFSWQDFTLRGDIVAWAHKRLEITPGSDLPTRNDVEAKTQQLLKDGVLEEVPA